MPLYDIPGVFCPMGCGQTLHLTPTGITCLARDCPDARAAHKILADPEHTDVVEFTEDGWTVLHPLKERLGGGLLSCRVHELCGQLPGPPALGKYRATVGKGGDLVLEDIPALWTPPTWLQAPG